MNKKLINCLISKKIKLGYQIFEDMIGLEKMPLELFVLLLTFNSTYTCKHRNRKKCNRTSVAEKLYNILLAYVFS